MFCRDQSRYHTRTVMCHVKAKCLHQILVLVTKRGRGGGGNLPQEGRQREVERYLVACNVHVSEMNCMSPTYVSMYDIRGNNMVLFANDMLQWHWTYLCRCRELGVCAACCPILPHQFLLSCTLPSFPTNQRKDDFNFCWFDWTRVELLLGREWVSGLWVGCNLCRQRSSRRLLKSWPHHIAAWDVPVALVKRTSQYFNCRWWPCHQCRSSASLGDVPQMSPSYIIIECPELEGNLQA